MQKRGKIIVIVAPSGTGKSTLISRLKNERHDLTESVSYTTRSKRPGEVHGVNYYYIAKEQFIQMLDRREFLEWAEVHGNFYGTSKAFVENHLNLGHNLLFDLDVQGCDSVKSIYGDEAKVIFIEPPSVQALEVRLNTRGSESEEDRKRRLMNAIKELERKNDYDYLILNEDFESCYNDLLTIIKNIIEGQS